jgi:TonB family protein
MCRSGLLLLLASAALARAQSGGDAASLVQAVALQARAANSWRAEGSLVERGADGQDQPAVSFRIAHKFPRYARLELTGGETPLVRVCEGTAQWTYYPALQGFVRVLLPQIGPCVFPINAWAALADTLQSPVRVSTDTVTVDGHPQPCQVVRGAFTWPARDPAVKETVTLCIDAGRQRILRYQLQHSAPGPPTTQTYTFSSLERDVDLPASLFQFQAPEGSRAIATIDWLTPISGTSPGVYQVSDQILAPILTSVIPPGWPAEAALLTGGNTVALQVEIGRDGIPHNIRVSRSLGLGLDEEALKCVSHWRFQPGMSAAGQVAVAATIFVHFMDPAAR